MSRTVLLFLLLGLVATSARAELLVLRFADVVADAREAGPGRLSREQLTARLDWLAAQGYESVRLQQVLDARASDTELPARALLLSFDGGYRSLESEVWPLLRAFGWSAVASLPTARIGHDPDRLDWSSLRAINEEGSIEFISGSHALDTPWPRTGDGDAAPLPARIWRRVLAGELETQAAYATRINADLAQSVEAIRSALGASPRAVAWPQGAWTPQAQREAQALGLALGFDLTGLEQHTDALPVLARLDVASEASLADFVAELLPRRTPAFRAVQIDLDYVYDPDPAQLERNLDALVERIDAIAPTHVWLQAFADPDGNGAADAVYFHNRHLPVRADLFPRVAELLHRKTGVSVHAWLPVLGWQWPASDDAPRALQASNTEEIPRLDPTDPRTRARVGELYAELAARAPIDGLLFHDDAFLREDELRSALPDDDTRVRALIEFTLALEAAAESERPRLRTARNLYARPLLEPSSIRWFAQTHASMLRAYDHVALMAMPYMEGAGDARDWLLQLAENIEANDTGFEHTVFVLQARDWASGRAVDDAVLIGWARHLRARGVRHLAYYPDDFIDAQPGLRAARAVASARRFPYLRDAVEAAR